MKNQKNIVQAIKCCLINGKFALLLFCSILLFTACKQSRNQNSESVSDQVSNLISSSPCDKFIGKYSRQQTASSITTTSNIEIKKDQDFYKLFISTNSTTSLSALELSVKMMNDRNKAIFPSDGIIGSCGDKGNIEINVDGKSVICMLDNNNNLIYGGLTFYKVNNESKEEVTEVSTELDNNVETNKNNELPFIGLRYFNFWDGKATEKSILINENGDCVIKSMGGYSGSIESEVEFKGKYRDIIDIGNDTYYKIVGNHIYFVDEQGKSVTDEDTNEPISSDLSQ